MPVLSSDVTNQLADSILLSAAQFLRTRNDSLDDASAKRAVAPRDALRDAAHEAHD